MEESETLPTNIDDYAKNDDNDKLDSQEYIKVPPDEHISEKCHCNKNVYKHASTVIQEQNNNKHYAR